jgi:RNA polymerase sigma-70 factor (ECF subfamily)
MQRTIVQNASYPTMPSDQEAQTIAAARKDPQAFGVLYDQFAPRIYRYLLSRLGSVEDARDITSQTFLTAFETFPNYQHKGYFSAWLFSIARNKYVDHIRKSNHSSAVPEDNRQDFLPDPLSEVIETERIVQLRQKISALSGEEQELLRLRYVAELGFAELAVLLKKNEDAVKKSLYRLLARLQSQMEA